MEVILGCMRSGWIRRISIWLSLIKFILFPIEPPTTVLWPTQPWLSNGWMTNSRWKICYRLLNNAYLFIFICRWVFNGYPCFMCLSICKPQGQKVYIHVSIYYMYVCVPLLWTACNNYASLCALVACMFICLYVGFWNVIGIRGLSFSNVCRQYTKCTRPKFHCIAW